MDPTLINTGVGIIAGVITIITGGVTIKKTIDERRIARGKMGSSPPVSREVGPIKSTSMAAVVAVPGVVEFSGDDKAYQEWVTSHPQGFVVNTNQGISPKYMVLHKARCSHVSNFSTRKQGAFTQGDFMKACAVEIDRLREWAKVHGRSDGSFSGECSICKPQ